MIILFVCVYTSIDIHEIDWVVHSFVRKSKTLDIAACPPPEQSAPQPAPPGELAPQVAKMQYIGYCVL